MEGWILYIVLSFVLEGNVDKIVLTNKVPYSSLEECQYEGDTTVNWLTQDFVQVTWECILVGE